MIFTPYDPVYHMNPFFKDPQTYYQAHAHEIAGSIVFYQVLYLMSPYISKLIFHKNYDQLSHNSKLNFDIHVVSMVQCLISIVAIVPLIGDTHLRENSVSHYTEYAAFVSSITIGYFLWDLFVCLRHFKMFGLGFLVHAIASLFVFASSLRPFCLGWVASFLAFELSTPFVNINWFANKLPSGSIPNWIIALNGLCLIITFFFVRILWGFYAIYWVICDFLEHWDEVPLVLASIVLLLNAGLDVLNVMWFQKMLQIAAKKLGGKSKKG
jgi:hypothetical protein